MLLDGISVAQQIDQRIASAISHLTQRKPGLAFLLVGDHPSSRSYIKMKKKKCAEVGILSFDREFPSSISQSQLQEEIHRLNDDDAVDGILVQLPLPDHIDPIHIVSCIHPEKDVDGFHPVNMGKLLIGETSGFVPCTPHGVHVLLNHYQIPLQGKHVVIVGRSNIVGKPLAALLMQKAPHCNATVTVVHSLSERLEEHCRSADVLIAAMGKPGFVKKEMVKPKAVVVDVGITRVSSSTGYVLKGDVDFAEVSQIASHITPVPGGIGPMTIAMLLSNTLLSYQRKQ